MNSKLTLRLDSSLIESAKDYSAQSGKSLSKIVADLFTMIKNEQEGKDHEVTPIVRSLIGVMKENPVREEDYQEYLEEKYK